MLKTHNIKSSIYCGIVLGPNSTIILKYMMPIAEKLAKNNIIWVICPDKKHQLSNDMNFLEKKKNIIIIPCFDCVSTSGGDRHGTGINSIIRYLYDKENIILLEPDLIPVAKNWDEKLILKINNEVKFISPKNIDYYYIQNENNINKKNYSNFAEASQYLLTRKGECVYCRLDNVCLLCLDPKFIYDLNVSFTKNINVDSSINDFLSKNNSNVSRAFKVNTLYLEEITEYPRNTFIQKETGWQIMFKLPKKYRNSLDLCTINNIIYKSDTLGVSEFELIFNNDELLAVHFHHSRYCTNITDQIKEFNAILEKFNIL